MDDEDHRLRRPAARRPRPARLVRLDQDHAAQLDRSQRRSPHRFRDRRRRRSDPGFHDPSRHVVRRHLHGAGAGAPAGRRTPGRRLAGGDRRQVDRRSPRSPVRRGRLPGPNRRTHRYRASGEQGEDRCLHRRRRHSPGHRQNDPGVHSRLRAHGVWHRRDHGGTRPGRTGLGVRRGLRPGDSPHRPTSRRLQRAGVPRGWPGGQQRVPRRTRCRRRQADDHRMARGQREG